MMKNSRFFDSRFFPLVFFLISFLFLLIYSWSTSPLFRTYGDDSATFQMIGLGILQGKCPYVDLFDHKGPLIFFYDALGLAGGRWGLFLLQTLWVGLSLWLMHGIACLFTDRRKAFFAVLLTLFPYLDFIKEGNQCEECMLPFIALSLLLALTYLVKRPQERHPLGYSLVYGISCGVLFLIRPNDAVSQIGAIMTGIFSYLLVRKEYKNAFANGAVFFGGMILAMAPVFAYFASRGAAEELWLGTVGYNLHYAANASITTASIGMFLIPAIFCISIILLARKQGMSRLAYIYVPMLLFTFILVGRRDYYNYMIVFLPSAAAFFALCLERRWKAYIIVICSLFAIFSYRQHKILWKYVCERENMAAFYEQTGALIRMVPEEERNAIWNYNLYHRSDERNPYIYSLLGVFLDSGITPGNRVFIDFHLANFGDEERIITHNPRWVLYAPTSRLQQDADYLMEHYDEVGRTDEECVYEIRLYRLKASPETEQE